MENRYCFFVERNHSERQEILLVMEDKMGNKAHAIEVIGYGDGMISLSERINPLCPSCGDEISGNSNSPRLAIITKKQEGKHYLLPAPLPDKMILVIICDKCSITGEMMVSPVIERN